MGRYYNDYYSVAYSPDYLEHHGIAGQKWGTRRYQYEDGSLTPEGRQRYHLGDISRNVGTTASTLAKRGKLGITRNSYRNIAGAAYNVNATITGAKNYAKSIGNARGIGKVGAALGVGREARAANAATLLTVANHQNRLANTHKYKVTRNIATRNASAWNAVANGSKAWQKSRDSGKGIVSSYINTMKSEMSTKSNTITGKESTYGKELVKSVIAGAVVGTAARAVINKAANG